MAHRVAPGAEADLDSIWYYVAKENGSVEIADRLVDSIAEIFLPATRTLDATAMKICGRASAVFPPANTSSSIASEARTF